MTDVSWRWIFYVNVPVGVAASVFTQLLVREHIERAAGALDVGGFTCSGGLAGCRLHVPQDK